MANFLPRGAYQSRLKRLGDLFASILLILLASPILLIFFLLIKIEDGGPIFYSQIRSGLDGKPYTVWKLRTMKIDAEPNGAQWVKRGDSRITSVGSF